jgi:hypothetical protein
MGRPKRKTPDYNAMLELTKKWVRDHGCFRNTEGVVESYFAKFESTNPNKPIWADAFNFNVTNDDWNEMMEYARNGDIFIAYEHFNGWYIGTAKDAGRTIASRMNHSTTHLNNSVMEMNLSQNGGLNPQLSDGFKGHVNGNAPVKTATNSITKMLKSIGVAVKKVVATDYLPAPTTDEE